MKNFKDYYKFPLHAAEFANVILTSDDRDALETESNQYFTTKIMRELAAVINGEKRKFEVPFIVHRHFEYRSREIVDSNGIVLLRVTGWTDLAWKYGRYRLDGDTACEIMDAFGEYVVKKLNGEE